MSSTSSPSLEPRIAPIPLRPGLDIPQLTGIRAIAALIVFAHHGNVELAPHFPWAIDLLNEGIVGVNIFFVLSGFLIFWRYGESATLRRDWLINYFRSRAARIYPLAILITLLTLWALGTPDPMVWLRCLTLTQGLTPSMLDRGVIPQAWTLTVEECFYFSAPVLFILCRGRQLKIRLLAATALAWAAGLLIHGPTVFLAQNSIFGHCFEFFVGIALADTVGRLPAQRPRGWPWVTALGIVGIIACTHVLAVCDGRDLPRINWIVTDDFVMPIPIAIFFFGLIREVGPIRWLLASRPAVFFGKVSFAFYLIHYGVFSVYIDSLGFNIFIQFVLLVIVASVLYLFVEEPLRRLLRGKRKARASVTS
jgi:peptidoglycan/LPS O-acetylase OafA/YrhL